MVKKELYRSSKHYLNPHPQNKPFSFCWHNWTVSVWFICVLRWQWWLLWEAGSVLSCQWHSSAVAVSLVLPAQPSLFSLGLVQALFISHSPDRAKPLANTNSQLHHLAAAQGASSLNILLWLLQITTFGDFKPRGSKVSIKPQQVTAPDYWNGTQSWQ